MRYAPRRSQPEEGAGRRDKLLDVNHRLFALQMVRPGLMYSLFYCVLLVVAVLFCFCERDWLQVSISERNPRRVYVFRLWMELRFVKGLVTIIRDTKYVTKIENVTFLLLASRRQTLNVLFYQLEAVNNHQLYQYMLLVNYFRSNKLSWTSKSPSRF